MSTKVYQFLGKIVTQAQLNEILKDYVPSTDNAEIVSWIEPTDDGIKVLMKDGQEVIIPISQAKEFETVEYDKDTKYLHFYDINRNDVYDPVYIEGGGGGSDNTNSARITLTNQNGTATFAIANGNSLSLMFNFTSTENDVATGDGTCQITVNGAVKSTFSVKQGLTTVDVASFLSTGSNTVRVRCTDVYGNYKTLAYTVSVIDMYIASSFDSTVPYSSDITYKFTPYGSIEKTIHILADGNEIADITTSMSGKQLTHIIPFMDHGVHRLEVYSTAELDGIPMESPHLIYDVMCLETGDTTAMIASAYDVATIKQGGQVSIPYIVYDPRALACDITLDIYTIQNGSETIYSTQTLTVDRSQQYWNTRKYPVGTVYFRIKYGSIVKTHSIEVTENDTQVEAETNDLELYLSSDGRSNNEATPGVWKYGNYSTKFDDFNWKTNGWVTDENGDACLRLNGEARAEINFKPFDNDLRTYGKTIEMEFTIRDVNSRNSTVISCVSGGIGFEVTADTAYIKSEQSYIFSKFKEDDNNDNVIDKVRIAFVVESRNEHRQLCIYLNGILSKEVQYPDSDNFQQTNPVTIKIGSSNCGIDLYSIRSYSTALTAQQIVNNRIADIKDIVERTAAYERNDIYDDYGNVSFEKCKEKNSVMVIIGELPTYKGDKKNVKIAYYDIDDSTLNFIDALVAIDVQGTSSQFYARKNWKLKCSEEHAIDLMQVLTKIFCIKVDYAEATGKHNTGNANFVHTLYSAPIPPQEDNPLTRTTIYGKPILLFHQANESSDPVFYGKSNFNFDKGSLEAFGFTSEYDVESWEFCNNTSDACNFLGEIPNIWADDFEARYPEDYGNIDRFKVMHDWVVSTRQDTATGAELPSAYIDVDKKTHTHDTAEYRLAKFKTEFEQLFDMHYSLIYYTYTFFALMVDQRAKNMFLTYWGKTAKWYPYFYDNDIQTLSL